MTIAIDSSKNKEFWNDINELTRILVKNDYDVLVRYEDCGVYVLDIAYSAYKGFGGDTIRVLNEDEWQAVCDYNFLKRVDIPNIDEGDF